MENDNSNIILKKEGKPLGVAIITPSGIFPADEDYRRAFSTDKIKHVLKQAAEDLHLTDTSDWALFDEDGTELDPNKTFAHSHLSCLVELDWHKREGGGGCM